MQRSITWLILATLFGSFAYAQKPEAILDRMTKAYHSARSFVFETEAAVTIRVREGRRERIGEGSYRIREVFERPNKVRMEGISTTQTPRRIGLVVCDGKQAYFENPSLKRTRRLSAAGVPLKNFYTNANLRFAEMTVAGVSPLWLAAHGNWRPFMAEVKLVGREKVGNRDTYRIRYRIVDTSMLIPEIERPIYEDLWIGVNDALIWKAESTFRIRRGNVEQIQTTTVTVTRQELNKPISPQEFEYRLPPGYQFVWRSAATAQNRSNRSTFSTNTTAPPTSTAIGVGRNEPMGAVSGGIGFTYCSRVRQLLSSRRSSVSSCESSIPISSVVFPSRRKPPVEAT